MSTKNKFQKWILGYWQCCRYPECNLLKFWTGEFFVMMKKKRRFLFSSPILVDYFFPNVLRNCCINFCLCSKCCDHRIKVHKCWWFFLGFKDVISFFLRFSIQCTSLIHFQWPYPRDSQSSWVGGILNAEGPHPLQDQLGPLTNGGTSPGCDSGVSLGPMVLWALFMKRCMTKPMFYPC